VSLKRAKDETGRRGDGETGRNSRTRPVVPSPKAPRAERRRLLLLLVLFALALGLWARAPLRQRWLERQSFTDLIAYVEAHPAEADAALLLAERSLRAGDAPQAEEVLRRLLQEEPTNPRAWLLRSQAEFEQGKLAAAYASLQVPMPVLDRSAEAHWRMGLLLERRGNEAGAEAEFHRAAVLDPEHAGARLELARGALAERHYGRALEHLAVVARREPDNPAALEALSLAYLGLGQLDPAEQSARRLVRRAPDAAGSWRALGQVLKDRATPAALVEAEQAYRRALQLAPDSSELHQQLGLIAFSRGDYARAAEELQRAIDLHPLNRQPYPMLMQCYRRLGMAARAERLGVEYRKIDEMDLSTAPLEYSVWAMPENLALRMRLARLYVRYRRPDLALTQVERVLAMNPNHAEARRLRQQLKLTRP
jgi:tetratricopeptide (TPR) repeat protein